MAEIKISTRPPFTGVSARLTATFLICESSRHTPACVRASNRALRPLSISLRRLSGGVRDTVTSSAPVKGCFGILPFALAIMTCAITAVRNVLPAFERYTRPVFVFCHTWFTLGGQILNSKNPSRREMGGIERVITLSIPPSYFAMFFHFKKPRIERDYR